MNKMVRFCQKCGSELIEREIDGRTRQICGSCGWIVYAHRKLSAGARIVENGKLLLVQRKIDPWVGCWMMPAGYIEVDEYPEIAAEREAREETGLVVRAGKLVDVYCYEDDPRGNGLVLIYDAIRVGGVETITPETQGIGFFSPIEIVSLPLAGASADRSVRDWLKSKT